MNIGNYLGSESVLEIVMKMYYNDHNNLLLMLTRFPLSSSNINWANKLNVYSERQEEGG